MEASTLRKVYHTKWAGHQAGYITGLGAAFDSLEAARAAARALGEEFQVVTWDGLDEIFVEGPPDFFVGEADDEVREFAVMAVRGAEAASIHVEAGEGPLPGSRHDPVLDSTVEKIGVVWASTPEDAHEKACSEFLRG